jgi:hypothetical protein
VLRICVSGEDAREVRLRALDELRRAVGFDACAWLLTDPETSVGSAPIAEVPSVADLPRLIRLKYLTEINRWTAVREPPVALLSQATAGELARSLVWRELLRTYGVRDVASAVFRERHGCWGFLDLWRSDGVFSQEECDFLRGIARELTGALRRALVSRALGA